MDAVGLRSRRGRKCRPLKAVVLKLEWIWESLTEDLKKNTDAWIPFPDNKILSVYGGPDKGIIFFKSDSTVQQGLEG